MVFYEYTLKKMLKSVSTYVTGVIAVIVPLIVAVLAVSKGSASESTLAMTTYFTFPVMIIFLAFKVSQIFRDEIENKTLLSIQAKPITRKQMVLQGLLAVNTLSVVIVLIGGFIPFMLEAIPGGAKLLGHGILITLTELLLLVIISVVALLLSLILGGKAFIGTMIGGFVAGFYVLFGITAFINIAGSRQSKYENAYNDMQRILNNKLNSSDYSDGVVPGYSTNDPKAIYEFTLVNKPSAEVAKELTDAFKTFDASQKQTIATISAWFNPVSHWTKMFSATEAHKVEKLDGRSMDIDIWSIFNSDNHIKIWDVTYDNGVIKSFKYQQVEKDMIPTWYPYIVWVAIAAIVVPISVRSIQRKNIA